MIWQYIEDTMSHESKMDFELRISEDELFNTLYQEQLKLHTALKKMPVSKAPDSLFSNVMTKYTSLRNKRITSTGFRGIWNIIIILTGIIILAAIMSIFITDPSESTAPAIFSSLTELGRFLSFDASIFKFLPYLMVFFSGLALYWFDHFLKQRMPGLSRG